MTEQPSYASIARNNDAGSSSEPLLPSHKGKDRIKRFEYFIKRNFLHILTLFTVIVILVVFTIYTLAPDSNAFPRKETNPQIIQLSVSDATMEAGKLKCKAIESRRRQRDEPNAKRVNPRAEPGQVPILLKNAVVWDGQGNVIEDVDVYIEDGTVREISHGIKVNKGVKVIDVAGHIVSPGLVDMHRYLFFYIIKA